MFKKVLTVTLIALGSLTLTACSQTVNNDEAYTSTATNEVSPAGVLKAAVLLSSGDIEKALENGTVTPEEVNNAKDAIEFGTLGEWQKLAEEELKK